MGCPTGGFEEIHRDVIRLPVAGPLMLPGAGIRPSLGVATVALKRCR